MKNLKLSKEMVARICVVCLLSVSLSSCLKENKNQNYMPPAGLVSFTQASPDQPIINFYLDANKVNAYPLNYGENLDYFQAFAGKRTANFYNAGTSNTILSDTVTFNQNAIYSLFLTGTTTKPEMVVVRDTLNRPAAGKATIRFINLSPDAPAVSLAVQGGAVLATNEAYKQYSSFAAVTGNSTYTFEVRQGTTNTVLATLPGITINSGFVYTIWFHGLVNNTSNNDKLAADITTNAYYY